MQLQVTNACLITSTTGFLCVRVNFVLSKIAVLSGRLLRDLNELKVLASCQIIVVASTIKLISWDMGALHSTYSLRVYQTSQCTI